MKLPPKLFRKYSKIRFRVLGLATAMDIPTEQFNKIMNDLTQSGWKKVYEYQGFDAWIDSGKVEFRKNGQLITAEWDNWTEGSFEAPAKVIEELAQTYDLKVTHEWRWSEYD
ncbi:MAG: hypothetical protein R3E90_07355 [Marinicella sp.]